MFKSLNEVIFGLPDNRTHPLKSKTKKRGGGRNNYKIKASIESFEIHIIKIMDVFGGYFTSQHNNPV